MQEEGQCRVSQDISWNRLCLILAQAGSSRIGHMGSGSRRNDKLSEAPNAWRNDGGRAFLVLRGTSQALRRTLPGPASTRTRPELQARYSAGRGAAVHIGACGAPGWSPTAPTWFARSCAIRPAPGRLCAMGAKPYSDFCGQALCWGRQTSPQPTAPSAIGTSRPKNPTHRWTRQYARIVKRWAAMTGRGPKKCGTHSLRRIKATLVYRLKKTSWQCSSPND